MKQMMVNGRKHGVGEIGTLVVVALFFGGIILLQNDFTRNFMQDVIIFLVVGVFCFFLFLVFLCIITGGRSSTGGPGGV